MSSILPSFSALENVALAVQARTARASVCSAAPHAEAALNGPAMAALAEVGLADRAHVRAGQLSHGEKRALELAIALAMEPKLLLLDEPMAGTGREETERLVDVLRRLKGTLCRAAGRARHDGGVRARGPHLRVGLRPHPRERHARGRCAPIRRSSPPISATRWSEAPCSRSTICNPLMARRRCCSTSAFASAPARSSPCSAATAWARPPPSAPSWAVAGLRRECGLRRVCSLLGLPPYRIAQAGLGLVPEGRQVFPTLTVEENLIATAASRFARPRWTLERVYDAVSRRLRSGGATWAMNCPAASSRCSRSVAR